MDCGTSLAESEFDNSKSEILSGTTAFLNVSIRTDSVQSPLVSANDQHVAIEKLRTNLVKDLITVPFISSPFERAPSDETRERRNLEVPLIYCDQTASNKSLRSIEAYINQTCLPLYGNTHTNTSLTGSQSTAFVAEARQIIAESVNAKVTGKASLDVVLFTGAGTTSAVETLIDCIGLRDLVALSQTKSDDYTKPVVFVGPYEHHSNILPWRESGADIINVPECPNANHDIAYSFLETQLRILNEDLNPNHALSSKEEKYQHQPIKRMIIGAFTAASNVTGKVCDVDRIATLLHTYGALAFFDYATAAPYLTIDMNPVSDSTNQIAYKDAIFLSPHKMIGGVNTPGILVVKKHLVSQTRPPSRCGGGTVFWVTHEDHRYLSNRVERYEGGTPNIIGIMRAGLAFYVKKLVIDRYEQAWMYGQNRPNQIQISSRRAEDSSSAVHVMNNAPPRTMIEYEFETHRQVSERLSKTSPNLFILGMGDFSKQNRQQPHLPIFSFLIKCGSRFLHYNYVCAILNDLFGIQSRGGCMCSGPYSSHLLGLTTESKDVGGITNIMIPNESNRLIEQALLKYKERAELLRPGYTRLSLPFKGLQSDQIEYVVTALEWIAKNGWAFMCLYRCNHRTGEWRHAARKGRPLAQSERMWLSHYNGLIDSTVKCHEDTAIEIDWKTMLHDALLNAEDQLQRAKDHHISIVETLKFSNIDDLLGGDECADKELDSLRWYLYPFEIASSLKDGKEFVPGTFALDDIKGAIRPIGFLQSHSDDFIPSTLCKKEEKLHFRDGEYHSGQAFFSDIEQGLREGELSTNTLIFNPGNDTWIRIDEYMSLKEKTRSHHDNGRSLVPVHNSNRLVCAVKKQSRSKEAWGKIVSDVEPQSISDITEVVTQDIQCFEDDQPAVSNRKSRLVHAKGYSRPPPKLMRYISQAIIQWNMIENGDRLLLGLSGGKDSLSLLHCLLEYRRKSPISFDLEICTIDPMTPSFDPSPLIPYVESLGLKYHYIQEDIVNRANSSGKDGSIVTSLCAFCARMKRGSLYSCARYVYLLLEIMSKSRI